MKNQEGLERPRRGHELKTVALIVSLISELTACIGGGVAIGYFFWFKMGAPKVLVAAFVVVTSLFGLVLGFYRLYRFLQKQE